MGFRERKGTRDVIFLLRMIRKRAQKKKTEVEKKGQIITKARELHLCFADYQKAFDRVKHDKLPEVMKRAGIPKLERRLNINLY